METNLGQKYKILGGNVVKLIFTAIGCLLGAVLLTAAISPALLAAIFGAVGIGITVDTSGALLPPALRYLLIIIEAGLLCAFVYFILSIFMNKFKLYENVFVIQHPFRTKTVTVANIQGISGVRRTQRWGLIPVSITDEFTLTIIGDEGKQVTLCVKSGQYRGLKAALFDYSNTYNKGWF